MSDSFNSDELRDGLLSREAWDGSQHEQYKQAVNDLLERRLTPLQRASFTVLPFVMLGGAILMGWLGATWEQLPMLARAALIEGTVFQLVAAGWCVRVLRSGVFHRRKEPVFQSSLMWCFAVLLAVHFLMLIPTGENQNTGVSLILIGTALMTLIGCGIQLLRTSIEQSELNTHERMLELALRLTSDQPVESE